MAYASPVSGDGGPPGSYPVYHMPVWVMVVRGFQLSLALIILIMAGVLMHGYVFSAEAFALVCALFTYVIALYAILTEKVSACRSGYNYWAIFSLDLLMIIFWLSSMGANAALRAAFRYSASATCYDDGSAVNADTCYTYKHRRSSGSGGDSPLAKRDYFASNGALALMSAIAGLSAIVMLLFVASFAYLAHQIRLHRQAESRGVASDDAGVVEMKVQATATTTPSAGYPTAYAGASSGAYAEVPNPTSAATQHYGADPTSTSTQHYGADPTSTSTQHYGAHPVSSTSTQHYGGGSGGYSAAYDYPATGAVPVTAPADSAPPYAPTYEYGQQQPPVSTGTPQPLHSYPAPSALPGGGQYYAQQ